MVEFFDRLHDPDPPRPPPELRDLVRRRASSVQRRRRLVTGAAAGLALLAGVPLGVVLLQTGLGSSSDCADAVVIDGRSYWLEYDNAGVVQQADLGRVVGVVERSGGCPDGDEGAATNLPVGSELREVSGFDPRVVLGVVDGGRVQLYRVSPGDADDLPLGAVLTLDGVVEVGIDSDGGARWATLDDPADVSAIVAGVSEADEEALTDDGGRPAVGLRVFLEFVRSDGMRTSVSYTVADRTVAVVGRSGVLSQDAAAIIDDALRRAPPAPFRDTIQVSGTADSSFVHDAAMCRLDRPDMVAGAGERLTVTGVRADTIGFGIMTAPDGEVTSLDAADLREGFDLPRTAGPVEIELVQEITAISDCVVVDVK